MSPANTRMREEADGLLRQARIYASGNQIAESVISLERAADLYGKVGMRSLQAYALGSAGYLYVIRRNLLLGLLFLKKAAGLGYHDLPKIEQLSRLRFNKQPLALHKQFARIAKNVRNNAVPIEITGWNSGDIDHWKWMRFTGPAYLSRIRECLPRINSRNEIKTILYLTNWVHKRFTHDPSTKPSKNDPLTILSEAKDKKHFTCQEYSILLAAALQAYSIPARVVALLKRHYQSGHGRGHWAVEAWSRDLEKWILVDPQNNITWQNSGVVLSAYEARQLYFSGKTPHLRPIKSGRPVVALKGWAEHFCSIWYYRNQSFERNWDSLGECLEIGDCPQPLFQNRPRAGFQVIRNPILAYPQLNKMSCSVRVDFRKAKFKLQHSYPFFKAYQLSYNQGSWRDCNDIFTHEIKPGSNIFKFRVRASIGADTQGVFFPSDGAPKDLR
jgi:hypothetical protein